MEKVRAARQAMEARVVEAQEELKAVLTIRQEAIALQLGQVNQRRITIWRGPDFASTVELETQNTDEQFLAVSGGGFTVTDIPFDTCDLVKEADHAARETHRIGHAKRSR